MHEPIPGRQALLFCVEGTGTSGRAAQPGRAWLSGGASVLTEPNVKSPSSAQQDSHDGRRPLLPENSMTNGSGAVLEPCLPLVLACVSGGDALVGGAAERQI